MVAADYCHRLLLSSDRQGLGQHTHHFIAHRASREIVSPRQTFHEGPWPSGCRAGALSERVHRAVPSELKRLGCRYLERVRDLLKLGIGWFRSKITDHDECKRKN